MPPLKRWAELKGRAARGQPRGWIAGKSFSGLGIWGVCPSPKLRCHPGESLRHSQILCVCARAPFFFPPAPWGRVKRLQAVWGGGAEARQRTSCRFTMPPPPRPRPEICSLTLTNCRPAPKGRVGRKSARWWGIIIPHRQKPVISAFFGPRACRMLLTGIRGSPRSSAEQGPRLRPFQIFQDVSQ